MSNPNGSDLLGDGDVTFAQCRVCRCTCIDSPVGLLNPQAQLLGTYDRHGRMLTLNGVSKGHFLHRCPVKK